MNISFADTSSDFIKQMAGRLPGKRPVYLNTHLNGRAGDVAK